MGFAIQLCLCIALIRDSGQEVAYPFIGKPDRTLYRDYYELIQHPVSLRSIQKKVRGTDSRKNTSKTTAYPTWQSFEEEVSYIWRNAREYNEDDSEISALAGILEVSLYIVFVLHWSADVESQSYFEQRVAEAKKLVPNPQTDDTLEMPRIKLKMSTSGPPVAGESTVRMPESSNTITQPNGQSANIMANQESSRPHQGTSSGSAGQNVSTSPRTRSLKTLDSPGPSVATTSTSDQLNPSVSARGLSGLVKNEPPMSMSTSQAPSHAIFGTMADNAHDLSSRKLLSQSSL